MAAKKYLDDTGLGHFWDKTAYKYGIERIVGTQSASTNAWTGVTLDKNCVSNTIPTGKVIIYKLPYAGTSSAATLNLTLPDGTTSGAKNVKYNTGSNVTTTYGAGCEIFMVFDGSYWKCTPWYDSNNYDRIRHNCAVKTAGAITNGQICVGTSEGYKVAASGVTFDITYPILRSGDTLASGVTATNFYDILTANLQTTKSGWTGTAYTQTWLVGTLSGTTFTIDSAVFTQTIPSTADGKVYTPLGITYDTKQIYLHPTNEYWEYRNGTFRPIANVPTLATVATSGSYNDLSNKPTIPAAQVQSNWTQTTTTAVDYIKNKPTLATVATSGSYNDLSNKPTIPTVNNATLTIQKNGSNVQTFTANQSTNVTANITVPTKISDLSNTSGGFVTYCTCSTAAATAAKVVTLDSGDSNWVLRKGDIIAVKFTNTNTASSVTLNVNSTGAKLIWYNNAAYTGSSNAITGYANRYLFYLYDGTNWVWFSDGRHDGNDNTYTTAYCSTASGTAAKGASMTGYVLTANRYTVITFTNANTYAGAVTLNINSKGAKPLYIDGKASSSTNYAFAAGSYIVWYDGTNYYLTTNGNIPRTLHSESGVSASTVTQTVTNDMIANGTIKFAKVDSTEFVKLTMSTTDISAGSALAKNTLYGVYT